MSPTVENVAEPEVDPGLAVPRGERIQPDFERVHPPVIQDGIHHVAPPLSTELHPRRIAFRVHDEAAIGNHLAELRAAHVVRRLPPWAPSRRIDRVLELEPGRPLIEPHVEPHPLQRLQQPGPRLPLCDQLAGRLLWVVLRWRDIVDGWRSGVVPWWSFRWRQGVHRREELVQGVVGRRPVGRVRTLTRQPQRPRVDPREPGAHPAAEPGERRQQPVHVLGADHVGIRPGHHVKPVERPQHVIAGKPA